MDRTKTIPEHRGMPADERPGAEKPYTALSYAAQYGITVEEAQSAIDGAENHRGVIDRIMASYRADPELRKAAISGRSAADLKRPDPAKREKDWPDVEGWSRPHGMTLNESQAGLFNSVPRRLSARFGDDAEQILTDTMTSEQFLKWLDERIAVGDHNIPGEKFDPESFPKTSRVPVLRLLAGKYLEDHNPTRPFTKNLPETEAGRITRATEPAPPAPQPEPEGPYPGEESFDD